MNWAEICTIIGSAFAVIGFVYSFIRNLKNDLDTKIDRLEKSLFGTNDKLDGFMKHSIAMQAEQSKRTDKLYEMFYNLLEKQQKG